MNYEKNILKGKAFRYGDNVDTDVIIPARYCTSYNVKELASHCMEDIDSEFVKNVSNGDIIVAGENFGCGSSRENAPLAIKGAGISCVIAKSFARIFYRNAINIGLPVLECPGISEITKLGDIMEISLSDSRINNITRGFEFKASPFPEFIQDILKKGSMVEYVRWRLKNKKTY